MALEKKLGLEKIGGALKGKEEMGIHVTSKLVVCYPVYETERSCPFNTISTKGCRALRLFGNIEKI